MTKKMDYSLLDQPQILRFVFYPRENYSPPPPDTVDHSVPLEKDISIGCRFYPADKTASTMLYFHGNGEVVYDYDDIASLYNRLGIDLFVTDYRDYRRPGGEQGSQQYSFYAAHRGGQTCKVCATPIERITVRNRGTYFCPKCQKDAAEPAQRRFSSL